MATQKFTVFFAWQSDSPAASNRNLIRKGLEHARSRVEKEHPGLRVILDEATRGMPGSPNIPVAILEKIKKADAFVADITTTIRHADTRKASPNANVLIELGYAIAHVGWGRIVMLFNKAHGTFPDDVPFDIDRHRASPYHFGESLPERSNETTGQQAAGSASPKTDVFDLLHTALAAIRSSAPPRPSESAGVPDRIRRTRRDTDTLRSLLSTTSTPRMDYFLLERIPVGRMPSEIFYYWEGFNAVVSSSRFYLYDAKLMRLVESLHNAWGRTLSFGDHFIAARNSDEYIFPSDLFTSRKEEIARGTASAGGTGNALRLEGALELCAEELRKDRY